MLDWIGLLNCASSTCGLVAVAVLALVANLNKLATNPIAGPYIYIYTAVGKAVGEI